MTPENAVTYVWQRLAAFGYRPELIGARWALRMVACDVDPDAFQSAWDAKGLAVLRGGKP